MEDEQYCPFSKAIFSGCCHCDSAQLVDQRARRVNCQSASDIRLLCIELDAILKGLGETNEAGEMTFAQLMKVRCGGLSGMQRVLGKDAINISQLVSLSAQKFELINLFPFSEIMPDIAAFKARRSRLSRQ